MQQWQGYPHCEDPGVWEAQGNWRFIHVGHVSDLRLVVPENWSWECFSGSSAQTQVQWVHVQPQHAQSRHEYSWALRTSGGWSLLCGYAAAGAGMGPRVAEQRLQQVDAADVTCQKCRSPWAECSADRCLACRHASPISPLQANDSSQSYGDLSGQRQEERKPWLLACLLSAFAGWSWCFSVPILIVACCPCSLPFPAAWTKSMNLKLFGNSQTRGPSSQQSSFE